MSDEIVAQSRSKGGGYCKDGPHKILAGGLIFKVSEAGTTTKLGNGPGRWVCVNCSEKYVWAQTEKDPPMPTLFD